MPSYFPQIKLNTVVSIHGKDFFLPMASTAHRFSFRPLPLYPASVRMSQSVVYERVITRVPRLQGCSNGSVRSRGAANEYPENGEPKYFPFCRPRMQPPSHHRGQLPGKYAPGRQPRRPGDKHHFQRWSTIGFHIAPPRTCNPRTGNRYTLFSIWAACSFLVTPRASSPETAEATSASR